MIDGSNDWTTALHDGSWCTVPLFGRNAAFSVVHVDWGVRGTAFQDTRSTRIVGVVHSALACPRLEVARVAKAFAWHGQAGQAHKTTQTSHPLWLGRVVTQFSPMT